MCLALLQIQNSIDADMSFDSGFKLSDIIVNVYSKLSCEVLLKSGNEIVHLLT